MHLVVDIGNTETVLGVMEPESGQLLAHWRLTTGTARTADEFDHLVHSLLARKGFEAGSLTRAVVGSVVPSINERMRAALEGLVAGPVYLVEAGAELALPPMEIPGHGTIALYLLGGNEHGLWQL